jgi:hypothetical protein
MTLGYLARHHILLAEIVALGARLVVLGRTAEEALRGGWSSRLERSWTSPALAADARACNGSESDRLGARLERRQIRISS